MERFRAVHIVDDEPAIRRSLSFMLMTAKLKPIPWVSGDALLEHAHDLEPGCILLDVRMYRTSGLDVQRRLIAEGVSLPIIVLTGHADLVTALRAMKGGAIDFLYKPVEMKVLLRALDDGFRLLAGEEAAADRQRTAQALLSHLNRTEIEILRKLSNGAGSGTVAEQLHMPKHDVDRCRANAMEKLGARDMLDAVKVAVIGGIV